jgi:hypothetical protein
LCDASGKLAGQLHCEPLACVFGKPFLDLERPFQTVAARIHRASLRPEEQCRLYVMSGCARVGERCERASERAILETEPRAAVAHVEMVVQSIGLAQAQCFLFAMKCLVHDESSASVAIPRQRQHDHRPGAPAPRKGGVGYVLILGQRRNEGIAYRDESPPGNSVVGDYETGLAIHQSDWPTKAALPEDSPIRFACALCVTQGGDGAGGVDLLCAAGTDRQRNRRREERRLR